LRSLLVPLLITTLAAACGDGADLDGRRGTRVGDQVADFSFADCDGETVSLSSYAASHPAVFLTIHAGWCPPCHKQHAFLRELHTDLGGEGLAILLVLGEGDYEGTGRVGDEYCADVKASQRFDFPVLQDEGFVATGEIVGGRYPTQIALDDGLTIRALDYGWDESFHRGYLKGAIEEILGER